jgi:hypothetical protein
MVDDNKPRHVEGVKGTISSELEAVTAPIAHQHLMSRLKATYLGMYKDGEEESGKREVSAA